MSKQRPYGTFEEAFYIELLTKYFYEFDNLMLDIIYFYFVDKANIKSIRMVLPWKYLFGTNGKYHYIIMFWQCLCHQWGEVTPQVYESYILGDNIQMIVDHVLYMFNKIIDYVPEKFYNENNFKGAL